MTYLWSARFKKKKKVTNYGAIKSSTIFSVCVTFLNPKMSFIKSLTNMNMKREIVVGFINISVTYINTLFTFYLWFYLFMYLFIFTIFGGQELACAPLIWQRTTAGHILTNTYSHSYSYLWITWNLQWTRIPEEYKNRRVRTSKPWGRRAPHESTVRLWTIFFCLRLQHALTCETINKIITPPWHSLKLGITPAMREPSTYNLQCPTFRRNNPVWCEHLHHWWILVCISRYLFLHSMPTHPHKDPFHTHLGVSQRDTSCGRNQWRHLV